MNHNKFCGSSNNKYLRRLFFLFSSNERSSGSKANMEKVCEHELLAAVKCTFMGI